MEWGNNPISYSTNWPAAAQGPRDIRYLSSGHNPKIKVEKTLFVFPVVTAKTHNCNIPNGWRRSRKSANGVCCGRRSTIIPHSTIITTTSLKINKLKRTRGYLRQVRDRRKRQMLRPSRGLGPSQKHLSALTVPCLLSSRFPARSDSDFAVKERRRI